MELAKGCLLLCTQRARDVAATQSNGWHQRRKNKFYKFCRDRHNKLLSNAWTAYIVAIMLVSVFDSFVCSSSFEVSLLFHPSSSFSCTFINKFLEREILFRGESRERTWLLRWCTATHVVGPIALKTTTLCVVSSSGKNYIHSNNMNNSPSAREKTNRFSKCFVGVGPEKININ